MSEIIPESIDIILLRQERQLNTNKQLFEALQSGEIITVKKYCNEKELRRYLLELDISLEFVMNKCKTDIIYAKTVAKLISKNSTRQCDLDETEQIRVCNIFPHQLYSC